MTNLRTLCFAVLLVATGCSRRQVVSTPSAPPQPPRIQELDAVLASAESFPCVAGLHSIPATVVEIGVFGNVPYQSFSNGNVEVNAYGDPGDLVGLEAGTKVEDPALQQCLLQFIAAQPLLAADQQRVQRLTPAPALDQQPGLTVEVTPRNAPDAFDAWWISLERPEMIAAARAPPEQVAAVTQPQAQWAPAPPTYYRRPPRVYVRYPTYRPVGVRVYVPGFRRSRGVYVHPAIRIR
ncbi:MAG: hypothetical protein Q8L48_04675 [Archangium sp.]|nr:hypothetical protein [Archangium sp.]